MTGSLAALSTRWTSSTCATGQQRCPTGTAPLPGLPSRPTSLRRPGSDTLRSSSASPASPGRPQSTSRPAQGSGSHDRAAALPVLRPDHVPFRGAGAPARARPHAGPSRGPVRPSDSRRAAALGGDGHRPHDPLGSRVEPQGRHRLDGPRRGAPTAPAAHIGGNYTARSRSATSDNCPLAGRPHSPDRPLRGYSIDGKDGVGGSIPPRGSTHRLTSGNAGQSSVPAGLTAPHNGWTHHYCAIVRAMDRAALSPLLRSFERHLRAENRSANTVESYLESVRQAEVYLAAHGRPSSTPPAAT